MSIHLHTAATLGGLVQDLGEYLRKAAKGFEPDPFDVWPVITPNFTVQEWVRLDLIQRFQGGIEPAFSGLDDGLWDAWKRLAGPDVGDVKPLSAGHLRDLVLALLLEPPNGAATQLEPVLAYLAPHPDLDATGEGGPERARRAWQIAEKIAVLFQQYESEAGLPDDGDPIAFPLLNRLNGSSAGVHPHLEWQKQVYRIIFQKGGLRSVAYPDRLTLRQMTATSKLGPTARPGKTRPIVVFGFDALPPLALDILRKLGEVVPVGLFLLDTGCPDGAPHPLDRWRAPFLDLRRRLDGIPAATAVPEAASDTPQSVLSVTQGMLRQSVKRAANRPGQDTSLQLWACPGPQREAELVARLLADQTDESGIGTTETAVLLTRPDEYLPLFKEAFQRLRIPFTSSGEGDALAGPYAAGVEALFDLAANGFTRAGVFRLLSNPCWQRTRRVRPEMVQDWLAWADELGIFAGFTAADKCRSCHLPGRAACDSCLGPEASAEGIGMSDAHTWRTALRRIRLGRLMECRDFSPADDEMPAWRGHAPFQDFATSDDDSLAAFSAGVEILHVMVRRLGLPGESRPCATWAADLREILDTCLAARPDQPDEIAERSQAFGMLDHIAELEPLLSRGLPLELVRTGLIGACATGGGTLRRPFMGGVTLAPLASAATIPWRRTFIVGLEETQFPGGSSRSSLNLVEPLPGSAGQADRAPVRGDDLGRQAFLQALLACRERMILTYSCIDPAKEAELNPSSVICDLEAFLRDNVLAGNAAFRRVVVPTTPLSDRFLAPDAEAWHDPVRLVDRTEWLAALLLARRNRSPRASRSGRLDRLLEEARAERGIPLPAPRETTPKDLTVRVSTYRLATFLRDPASAVLERWIYMEDAVEDWEEITAAPLVANQTLERSLMRRCIDAYFRLDGWKRQDSPEAFFQRAYDWERLRSRLPDGLWGRVDRHRLTERFAATVLKISLQMGDRRRDEGLDTIELGRFSTSRRVRGLPPLKMRIPAPRPATPLTCGAERPKWTLELSGRLPLVWSDTAGLHSLVVREGKSSQERLEGSLLAPLLTYLGLLAWDEDAAKTGAKSVVNGVPLLLHVISSDGATVYRFPPEADFARSYLTHLAGQYLGQRQFEDLRLKIVNAADLPDDKTTDDAYLETLNEKLKTLRSGKYPPMFFNDLFDTIGEPEIPRDARDKVNRRLVPILDRLDRIENAASKEADE
ncbi:MAG TPA: exodeoxyribonuclease V subunit gamma [Candidatus Ozemobacteraceae bacterium]|nr:exodeoxyribonuclease V subunit gamma [Candidatus Ozemobacteraceae bacterium]